MEQEENMTVAVIDDNGEWRKILSSMVKEAIPSACINVFGSVRAFVADNTHYNLVIADVVLAEKEVFAYAEILERRVDYVVYASVIKEKATFAYFPKTVGFISKLDDRTENVCKIKGIHDRFLVKILTFDTEYGKVNVNPDAIIMMNVESRDIKVAMENKKELILKRTSMRKMLPFIEPFLVLLSEHCGKTIDACDDLFLFSYLW